MNLQGILALVKTGHNDDIKSTIDLLLIWWYSSDPVHHKFTEITNAIAFFFCKLTGKKTFLAQKNKNTFIFLKLHYDEK